MLNSMGLFLPNPMASTLFQRRINAAYGHFKSAENHHNDPPISQMSMAKGMQELTEAVCEIGLKLNTIG